ncbi:DUF1868 domain-containing protein [Cyanobacterium aponinum UTEX 3222]|uniref:DUF1868 domain-containing protein n=3 Tax=Cyanobacterium TaxID=102234 RepID=A0A844GSG2_9CHRO|nr:DUF1868 domain-containing protein [Cyanobacterium aponinum]MTF39427.1 DUF1868 domain-containing protein [Cyanobacterium aponinum 0216]WPF90240.1 DUF1868 domain-containing protein [Cyanobacterium aponinum AL20115]WRL38704.1 DUF1868 domain-containing protein [Cyanobacterium aponinum UTEX 3221]WRL41007.1 DUF1868 domain-containing protein [Cyanobacterium aponinum UTEX 3222]
MDGNYQDYINRVVQMTLPSNYKQQVKNIQSSPKFVDGKAIDFPGFSVITPPEKEETNNKKFYSYLQEIQTQITQELPENLFLPVPPQSFHLTIADLIWDTSYTNAVKENPDFDNLLISEIDKIFKEYAQLNPEIDTLELEVLGLSVFPRAIAVCLAPTEDSYNPIIKLRQLIYQNEQIIKLGIEQQYDFVGHITLGYFDKVEDNIDREQVELVITKTNEQLVSKNLPTFELSQWELRKFTDMTNFIREQNWASIKVGN